MFSAINKKLNLDPVYNLHFILMCLSSLLFSASFNMMIPELPAYLSSMGGAEYKGFGGFKLLMQRLSKNSKKNDYLIC